VPGSENFRFLKIRKKQDIFTEYDTPIFSGISKLSYDGAPMAVIRSVEIMSVAKIKVLFGVVFGL
jgi:hypothetical protein